jgi:MFS superfamily sulfate permease-like transporter
MAANWPHSDYDVVAGLTAAAVVVPQAMAYAAIAGQPLVTGLFTALVPLVDSGFRIHCP